MSSEPSNELLSRITSSVAQINSTIKPVHLVLASRVNGARVNGAGPVEVMEWVDGAVQTPSGDRNTHQAFVWPTRTEFPNVRDACVEILAWDDLLEYTVSAAKQTEEAGKAFMEARSDANIFIQKTQEPDEDQDKEEADALIERLEDAWRNLRNSQERLRAAIALSTEECGRFLEHLKSLEKFTNVNRPTDARFTAERELLWKTAARRDLVMRKLQASCQASFFSTQQTKAKLFEDLRSLNHDLVVTQDHLVVLESRIQKSRYRELRDLDILTSKDKGKGEASASKSGDMAGTTGDTHVLEGAIGLHVALNEPSSLTVFPVLRWKDHVSARLSPYLSQEGLEPRTPAGAERLDEESMDHIPFVFHLEDGVPSVSPELLINLSELMTSCTKWLEDMKDPHGSTRTKIIKLGSSASETSPQDFKELSEMARLEYDRLGFLQRASSILPRAVDRFAVAARKKLNTSISNALERGTTEESSKFAKLWVDLLRAEVEHSLWEAKSEISRISYGASKAANDKKKQTRRKRKETEQAKTASEYKTLATKLKVQASETATELGVAVPTCFDELVNVQYELDSRANEEDMPVTPTINTSMHVDSPSNQGAGLYSPASVSFPAADGLEAELDKLDIEFGGAGDRTMIPAVPSPIKADWHSEEAAGFLTVPSRKSVRSNSDVTSEHSAATTSSTALAFSRFVPNKPKGFQTDQWYKEHNRFQLYNLGFDEDAFMEEFLTARYVPEDEDEGQEDQEES